MSSLDDPRTSYESCRTNAVCVAALECGAGHAEDSRAGGVGECGEDRVGGEAGRAGEAGRDGPEVPALGDDDADGEDAAEAEVVEDPVPAGAGAEGGAAGIWGGTIPFRRPGEPGGAISGRRHPHPGQKAKSTCAGLACPLARKPKLISPSPAMPPFQAALWMM